LFLKEVDKGRSPVLPGAAAAPSAPKKHARVYPMLARQWDAEDHVYPTIVQPKLDGMRAMVFLQRAPPATSGDVVIYSRLLKDINGFEHLRRELLPSLIAMYDVKNDESLYIDGEFYEHGKRLQEITGTVRNIERNRLERGIKLHVFDAFYPGRLAAPYSERLKLVEDLFRRLGRPETVEMVPVVVAHDEKEADREYERLRALKYEGAMYKAPGAPYLGSTTGTSTALRSHDVLKRKPEFTDEFETVGFKEGSRGKDRGAIIWTCRTKAGMLFDATPKNSSYEERSKLYTAAKASFEPYLGRMITVEYQDLSKDGVPLRAKALGFRDYE
jgi:ATP-dependent DNA ligase